MTESEAKLYLPFSDMEDLEEVYEQKLFEQKQFFLQRMPVSKIIASRMSRLQKIEEAFVYLGGEVELFRSEEVQLKPYLSQVIKETFSIHERNKNLHKLRLNQAQSVEGIRFYLNQLLEITVSYAQKWRMERTATNDSLKVSTEPDSMFLLEEINKFEELGFRSFDDLQHLLTESPLVQEAIR
jgi:hypothetical protein